MSFPLGGNPSDSPLEKGDWYFCGECEKSIFPSFLKRGAGRLLIIIKITEMEILHY
jgi:hypothetical protein